MRFLLPVAWDHVITLKQIKLPGENNFKWQKNISSCLNNSNNY